MKTEHYFLFSMAKIGSEMGNERGKGSLPLILFIKLRYSEFGILMPMVHVIPDWVPYALNHFLFKGPFINAIHIHQYLDMHSAKNGSNVDDYWEDGTENQVFEYGRELSSLMMYFGILQKLHLQKNRKINHEMVHQWTKDLLVAFKKLFGSFFISLFKLKLGISEILNE